MKNKLGQGLAVGLTAIGATVVAIVGLITTHVPEVLFVMLAPVGVTLLIMLGDGWE